MWKTLFYNFFCVPFGLVFNRPKVSDTRHKDKSAHDFRFISIVGEDMPLAQFKGKPVLVVNTACECGFTGQYKGLQELWERYKDRGLVVIGVPSNDFGGQEPGPEKEIKKFCETTYGVTFYLTSKEFVKGGNAHAFYRYARATLGNVAAPKWNFHKYLIAPDGRLVDWYATTTSPLDKKITQRIEALLG